MNNKEIAEIIRRDPRARRVFRGVFPRDRLPRKKGLETRRQSAYIVNTDRSVDRVNIGCVCGLMVRGMLNTLIVLVYHLCLTPSKI